MGFECEGLTSLCETDGRSHPATPGLSMWQLGRFSEWSAHMALRWQTSISGTQRIPRSGSTLPRHGNSMLAISPHLTACGPTCRICGHWQPSHMTRWRMASTRTMPVFTTALVAGDSFIHMCMLLCSSSSTEKGVHLLLELFDKHTSWSSTAGNSSLLLIGVTHTRTSSSQE